MQFIRHQKTGYHAARHGEVVFLPGWGTTGRILELMEPGRSWFYPDSFLDPETCVDELAAFLDANNMSTVNLVGWSLGGYLALEFARRYPARVASLSLLALRKDWPDDEVEAMNKRLLSDPVTTVVEFHRRCFLGHKQQFKKFVDTCQPDVLDRLEPEVLAKGLEYLRGVNASDLLPPVDTCLYHGKKDIVAPLAEAPQYTEAKKQVFPGVGHPVFLAPNFALPHEAMKEVVCRKFSRAAASYDDYAVVQRMIISGLAGKLPAPEKVGSILEFGCGTGNYTLKLAESYPEARLTAIDFSEEMIRQAHRKVQAGAQVRYLCCDAEKHLAETVENYDLITSNATLQWFDSLPAAVDVIYRLLPRKGIFLATIFGPQSLHELTQGLKEVCGIEKKLPVARFPDKDVLGEYFREFSAVEITEEIIVRRYESIKDLLLHIRKTGTGGWHAGGPPVFTKKRLQGLETWFEKTHGGHTLSYQVFTVMAEK